MSIFRSIKLSCPACQTKVDFNAVHSVNADRRPDLRANILAETFQQERCPNCGKQFRLDPEFNLMDTKRGQWLAAAPLRNLPHWVATEKHARELFDRAYGPEANPMAQEIGKSLQPRITFGWPALREKLLVSEYLLDDVVLELCKMFIMRNSDSPMSAETELRLIDVVENDLVFGWLMMADETPGPTMRVARTVYDQIAADEEDDWGELKALFDDVYFVDLNRLLMNENEGEKVENATVPPKPAGPSKVNPQKPPVPVVAPPTEDQEEKAEPSWNRNASALEDEETEDEEAEDSDDGPTK